MTDPLDLAPLTADALAADATAHRRRWPSRGTRSSCSRSGWRPASATASSSSRVYPDQLHVDAHDPRLSAAEIAAGEEFWRAQWRTGTDRERAQRAWSALADRCGPGRAAWVVRATSPTNPQARPDAAVADGAPLSAEPDLPRPRSPPSSGAPRSPACCPPAGPRPPTRRGPWSRSPPARPITADLAVGPDLSVPLVHDEHGDDEDDEVAAVDRAMSWLVDFAHRGGRRHGAAPPGLRAGGPAPGHRRPRRRGADGAGDLATLLDAQRYSEGLAFLDPETPTNNAEGAPSGWSSAAPGTWAPTPRGLRRAHRDRARALATRPSLPGGSDADESARRGDEHRPVAVHLGLLAAAARGGRPRRRRVGAGPRATVRPAGWAAADAAGGPPAVRAAAGDVARPVRGRRAREPPAACPRRSRGRRVAPGARAGATDRPGRRRRRPGRRPPARSAVRPGPPASRVRCPRSHQHVQLFLGRRLGDAGFWEVARDRALPIAAAAGAGLVPAALTVHEPDSAPVTVPLVGASGDLRDLLAADVDQLASGGDDTAAVPAGRARPARPAAGARGRGGAAARTRRAGRDGRGAVRLRRDHPRLAGAARRDAAGRRHRARAARCRRRRS